MQQCCSFAHLTLRIPWHAGWMDRTQAAVSVYFAQCAVLICGLGYSVMTSTSLLLQCPRSPQCSAREVHKCVAVQCYSCVPWLWNDRCVDTVAHCTPEGNERFFSATSKCALLLPAVVALVVVSCRNRYGFMSNPRAYYPRCCWFFGLCNEQKEPYEA